ncbi:uncharacterized protein F4822DRAFT_383853 [Hypoxylon trugodes]|uniref:uncharacterized protein n=1 Tax=Hypoxylon trugodes TaxID=326681 RepID=UPI00218EF8A9|nr:uncharacterized protein F4822DRAFT_383853 [Hypoxylon trugodes]KAI1393210.1 hypothetical protein F4822DRAFT_383853 [Hypoxylon trugodes]
MSDSQADSGPPLLRPIPRRPFQTHREPTPPEDTSFVPPPPNDSDYNTVLNLESLNSRLLDPMNNASAPESASISRAQSSLNLTGSTLMGIYSQTPFGKDKFYMGDEPNTPWGTGAETPAKSLSSDNPYFEIQKERAQPTRRRSSLHSVTRPQPLSIPQRAFYLGSRGLLLYGLGVLYGMLVAQLRERRQPTGTFQMDDVLHGGSGGYDAKSMAFWGISAVVMGCLLPWFDNVWERTFGREEEAIESAGEHTMAADHVEDDSSCSTDWPLAVRGIGAFIGIAFAIVGFPSLIYLHT